ncbi:MAG: purine-nucleoside phosphorylase [Deltaproteobacteria bacterium]|nr:purine-nucleoside phosphorylase [Deltaproteobacteria bacterium]
MKAAFVKFQQQVAETRQFLTKRLAQPPEVLVITGTGQGKLPPDLIIRQEIPYADVPHFPTATAPGHGNTLISGIIGGRETIILRGRFHYYEGYSINEITLAVRVLSLMGASVLLAGNTAGGLNPEFNPGDLMVIDDHLNFMGANPLRGPNQDEWGPRFPDMSQAYSEELLNRALAAARQLDLPLKRGVYAAVAGPSIETPAETRFLRLCGADAVGMSTIPEVIVARHAGMEVLGLSIIANINDPDNFQPVILEEVIARVEQAEEGFWAIINAVITPRQIQ